MKKKIFLLLALVAMLACVFAFSVSAETVLKPQTSNDYGDISLFDESITVGRTDTRYGYTPYISTEGTDYARVVIGDGTTFYTFPTAYVLSNTGIWGSGNNSIFVLDLASLNAAMKETTNTDPKWTKTNIYRIELPANMTRLNAGAQNFGGYSNVIEIRLQPNSGVQDSGKNMVFWKCHNLETIHNLDSFVFTEGSLGGSFQECKKLKNITLGVSPKVTRTDNNTFNGCTSLESVNFAEAFPNLKTIGNSAFNGCSALTSIDIPMSVNKIESNAFRSSGLTSVVLPAGLTSMGDYVFHSSKLVTVSFADGFTGTLALNTGVFQNVSSLESISLPEGITTIGKECFSGCAITSISLPDSVTSIGNIAFGNCKKLSTFTINSTSNLESIGSQAFKNTAITSFYFPNSLTSIGNHAFAYNEGNALVELVNFENCGITSIPNGLFRQCGGLKTIKFPKGITSLNGSELFTYCKVDTIILPKTLTTISNKIEATSIGKIIFAAPDGTTLPANIPDNVTVEYQNYCDVYYDGAHYEDNNPCVVNCKRCGATGEAEANPIHNISTIITYVTYDAPGEKVVGCTNENCKYNETTTTAALFRCLGVSVTKIGNCGAVIGFAADINAIAEYESVTGKSFAYGVFAGGKANLGSNDLFNKDGSTINGVISASTSALGVSAFEIKVVGFKTDEQKQAELAMGAYVEVTENGVKEYTYIQIGSAEDGEKYFYAAFNDMEALAKSEE